MSPVAGRRTPSKAESSTALPARVTHRPVRSSSTSFFTPGERHFGHTGNVRSAMWIGPPVAGETGYGPSRTTRGRPTGPCRTSSVQERRELPRERPASVLALVLSPGTRRCAPVGRDLRPYFSPQSIWTSARGDPRTPQPPNSLVARVLVASSAGPTAARQNVEDLQTRRLEGRAHHPTYPLEGRAQDRGGRPTGAAWEQRHRGQ